MKKLISYLERPSNIDDILGQHHIIGNNKLINKMIKNDFIFSIIFFGPPGIGKTSICIALCKTLNIKYKTFNAAYDKKDILEEIINISKISSERYVIIIDEIHRMNKDKQDILLSFLEKGNLILLGTTIENPYFVLNISIRSRCKLIELFPLSSDDVKKGLINISKKNNIQINEKAIDLIIKKNHGDYRSSINFLEILSNINLKKKINEKDIREIPFENYSKFTKNGNEMHDLKSALQKSIRGSDPDAAIYWLSRLLESTDLETICRRILICAYEDVGLANPNLLSRVYDAMQSAKEVGLPEAKYVLSYIVLDITLSPKSNSSANAINSALGDIKNNMIYNIPNNIKHVNNTYKYPHDYKDGWIEQDYLPHELKHKKYYIPSINSKIELRIKDYWKDIKKKD